MGRERSEKSTARGAERAGERAEAGGDTSSRTHQADAERSERRQRGRRRRRHQQDWRGRRGVSRGARKPRRGRATTYWPPHAGGVLGRRAASSLLPKWELMIKLCMLDVVICGDRCGDRARCALKGWKQYHHHSGYKEFTWFLWDVASACLMW